MVSFDKGPPAALANHFAQLPDIPADFQKFFWNDWGPVFYRGRLTGKARLLGIASDPGPTERVVGRTLVGDAGQRVQGFLDKLGLTRSYVLVNAFPVAVHPSQVFPAKPVLSDKDQLKWRNRFYDLVAGPELQAIVAFGGNAVDVVELWNEQAGRPGVRGAAPLEPRQRRCCWRSGVRRSRTCAPLVTPDDDGSATGPNYGTTFKESDYQGSPPRTSPSGCPPGSATTPGAGGPSRATTTP